jgi:hypothetical protein
MRVLAKNKVAKFFYYYRENFLNKRKNMFFNKISLSLMNNECVYFPRFPFCLFMMKLFS